MRGAGIAVFVLGAMLTGQMAALAITDDQQLPLKLRVQQNVPRPGTQSAPRRLKAAELARQLQPRRYQHQFSYSSSLRFVTAEINRASHPEAPPPPPAIAVPFGLDRTLRNFGLDALATVLAPLSLSRNQLEYVGERTFELATGQTLRLYENRW